MNPRRSWILLIRGVFLFFIALYRAAFCRVLAIALNFQIALSFACVSNLQISLFVLQIPSFVSKWLYDYEGSWNRVLELFSDKILSSEWFRIY